MVTETELKAIVMEVLSGLGYRVAAGPVAPPTDGAPASAAGWQNPEAMAEMLAATPARIGIRRAGCRYETSSWLQFRMDHAAARDAIFHEVKPALVERLGALRVTTRVENPRQFLLRPDLGRRLSPESEALLRQGGTQGARVQLIVVDGLSGTAVEQNALDFIRAFTAGMKAAGLGDPMAHPESQKVGGFGQPLLGTPIYVSFGRVAIMDHIGELLKPDLVVELVGERPGLVTAESMSAYFCHRPNLKSIESDRTLISNIHKGGIPSVEAGAHAAGLAAKILAAGVSGVKLAL